MCFTLRKALITRAYQSVNVFDVTRAADADSSSAAARTGGLAMPDKYPVKKRHIVADAPVVMTFRDSAEYESGRTEVDAHRVEHVFVRGTEIEFSPQEGYSFSPVCEGLDAHYEVYEGSGDYGSYDDSYLEIRVSREACPVVICVRHVAETYRSRDQTTEGDPSGPANAPSTGSDGLV